MKHEHKFVPVDVTWEAYWQRFEDELEGRNTRKPHMLILACECGAVKLVKATLVDWPKEGRKPKIPRKPKGSEQVPC